MQSFRVVVLATVAVVAAVLMSAPLTAASGRARAPTQVVDGVGHVPPVDAPVLDPFRAPPEPWLAGNRGIEYGTAVGDVIRASAPGLVTFAGQVAGSRHVTIRHTIDLVSTAAFVGDVLVSAGERVAQGDPIAIAAGPFHFTARRTGEYIDPVLLFDPPRFAVRLVPIE